MIPFHFSRVKAEVLLCQYAAVHRRSLIRVAARLAQIIVVMLGKNTEPDFIKPGRLEARKGLRNPLVVLQLPHVAGGAYGIIGRTVLICKMIGSRHPHRAVIALRRRNHLKRSPCFFPDKAPFNGKSIGSRKGGHKPYFVNSFSIIKTVHRNRLVLSTKASRNTLFQKGIASGRPLTGDFDNSPSLYLLFVRDCIHFFLVSASSSVVLKESQPLLHVGMPFHVLSLFSVRKR